MPKRVGEDSEKKILRIIHGLRKSEKYATQAELVIRTGLDTRVVRQILRRLRRQKKVEVIILESEGKKKTRAYT